MDWLTQNWIWIALLAVAGAVYYFGRSGSAGASGGHGGCCSHGSEAHKRASAE